MMWRVRPTRTANSVPAFVRKPAQTGVTVTASEWPCLRLNITGLVVGRSAAYERISAGDIQRLLAMKSRVIM